MPNRQKSEKRKVKNEKWKTKSEEWRMRGEEWKGIQYFLVICVCYVKSEERKESSGTYIAMVLLPHP